jgi:hypothetical protein
MPRIAISGHRGLPSATERLVQDALTVALARVPGTSLVGVSCLADGADALFAEAVLDRGGRLEVVVPAVGYRDGLPADHHETYDRLLEAAEAVHQLNFQASTSEAHMAASERMLDLTDELFAVWDGLPAHGYGGTADVVTSARRRGIPVTVLWPPGARRG